LAVKNFAVLNQVENTHFPRLQKQIFPFRTRTDMTRDELQRRIAQVNRDINDEVSKSPLPNFKPKPFPTGAWVLGIICAALGLFGGQINALKPYYDDYGEYGFYAAAVFGIYAVLRTLLWLFQGKPKGSREYMESTTHVRELQERRRELEMQLKEIDPE
jgi:hypothetical protein